MVLYKIIIIPENTLGGYKTVRLSNKKTTYKILCVAYTDTWQAYNDWGGASFYRYIIGSICDDEKYYSKFLSNQRPQKIEPSNTIQGNLFNAELGLIHWLERENYEFDVVSDIDIETNPKIFLKYKMVILNTHSEY